MKGELEELGEDSEGVENISKMQGQILKLTRGKVNIFDGAGDFKSTYDILTEIAAIYDKLSSTEQADLLETMAGKHRANDLAAFFSNYEVAIDMVDAAENSFGSAAEENQKFVDSLQGRINTLQSAIQNISNSFMSSGLLKGGVGAITDIVNGASGIIDTFGAVPTVLTAASMAFSVFNKGIVTVDKNADGLINKFNMFGVSLGKIPGMLNAMKTNGGLIGALTFDEDNVFKGFASRLDDDKKRLQDYFDFIKSGNFANADQALSGGSDYLRDYIEKTKEAEQSVSDFANKQQESFVKLQAQNTKLKSSAGILAEYNDKCKNVGMSQQKFARTVGEINPVMGKYLSGLNGAKASMGGYIASLARSTAATVALTAASTALNAVLTMGIGVAISAAVTAISNWIHAEENLAKTVDDATTSFKQQHDELTKNRSQFEEAAEAYSKLQDGVSKTTGKNISLTPDEYDEYINAVNTIADMTPSLVAGYDAQGNAILDTAGDVETLTDAYNKLIIAENNKLLNGDGEDYKGIEDISNDLSNFYNGTQQNKVKIAEGLAKVFESGKFDSDSLIDDIGAQTKSAAEEVAEAMKEANKTIEGVEPPNTFTNQENSAKYLAEVYKQYPEVIRGVIDEVDADMADATEEMRMAMEARMENNLLGNAYSTLFDEDTQNMVSEIIRDTDASVIAELNDTGGEQAVLDYVDGIFEAFGTMGYENSEMFQEAFNMQDVFDSNGMSLGLYKDKLGDLKNTIDSLDVSDDVKNQLKDFFNIEDVEDDYDALVGRLKEMGVESAESFADGMTSSEIEAFYDIAADVGDVELDEAELKERIMEAARISELINLEVDIKVEADKVEAAFGALGESLSGKGLSTENIEAVENMFQGLSSYDPSSLFERTANGIRMNSTEFRRLNAEYAQDMTSQLENKMSSLGDAYNKTNAELVNLKYGTDEYNDKQRELSDIEKAINETEQLAAQYQGLASAYNQWQMAESAGSQRDMYESVISGFENIDDELSRGWVDDATIEFMELISGKNLSTAGIDELKSTWDGLSQTIENTSYSVRDFFTKDKNGKTTSDGVYNFLDAIGQLEEEKFGGVDVVKRDENGVPISFDFQTVGGDKAIADALGISEEMVQIMLRAADDAGFVVSMDGTYQNLDILKAKAQEAAVTLKSLGKTDFDFNFNSTNVEDINTQIEKANKVWSEFKNNKDKDGNIKMDVPGAQEAFTVISTLTTLRDELSEPAYMKLNAEDVDADMREPLAKMQEFNRLTKEEHQLSIKDTDTSGLEKSKDEILDYFEDIQENQPELAAKMDIDGLTREELEGKIDTGELSIPLAVDIQMEMNDSLQTLADKAMLDAGMITQEQFEERVNLRLGADVDSSDAEKAIEESIDEAIESSGVELTEEQEFEIKAFAKVFGVEDVETLDERLAGLDDKTFKVLADVLGKVDVEQLQSSVAKLDDKTVEAIAKAMGEGDVQGLQTAIQNIPDQKVAQAIAQAFGYNDVSSLVGAIGSMDSKTVQAIAQALGITNVDNLRGAVNRLNDKEVQAVVDTSGQAEKVTSLQSVIDGLRGKTVNIIASVQKAASDAWNFITGAGANGTAHVEGTAFANGSQEKKKKKQSGDWSTHNSGTALMGELGQETIVRDGRFFTVGDSGAEFVHYKKGDIIFNHKQTEELFKNGYVTSNGGRGRAYVSGTAFGLGSSGSGGGWGRPGTGSSVGGSGNTVINNYNYNVSSGSSKSTKSSKAKSSTKEATEEAEKFEETIDLVEIAIDRIERAIKNLDTVASSAFRSWSERTSALNKQIAETRNEIDLQQRGYDRYMKAASEVGLDAGWVDKIKNGKVDVELITNSDLKDKIDQYQEW